MNNEDIILNGKLEEFQKLLEFVPDAMMIADSKGDIVVVNSQAEKLFGYKKEELLKQPIEILVPQRFRKAHLDHRSSYMADPNVRPLGTGLDLYARHKNGTEIPVEISLGPAKAGKEIFVVVTFRDVTARKRDQEILRKAHAELELRVAERTAELRSTNESLRQEIAERKRLELEIIAISEREQQRIGQDLHDVLGQTLTAASYKAKLIEKQLMDKIAPEPEDARKIVKLLSDSIGQARSLARGLYPAELRRHGLVAALKELAGSITHEHQIACNFECDDSADIGGDAAIQLYRITQEAVNNVVKHANPKTIVISLRHAAGGFVLCVRDDGKGLPKHAKKNQGMGLHIMAYRARMIGAKLSVQSRPEGGTLVSCSIEKNGKSTLS